MMQNLEILEAIYDNDVDLLALLLEDGAPPDHDLFRTACGLGHLEVVRMLIEAWGPDTLDAFDEMSNPPLTHAAREEHIHIIEALISAGANVNAHEEHNIGNTPLRNVLRTTSFEVVEFLLKAGANPNIPGWMQLTALHVAEDRAAKEKSQEARKIVDVVRRYSARFR